MGHELVIACLTIIKADLGREHLISTSVIPHAFDYD